MSTHARLVYALNNGKIEDLEKDRRHLKIPYLEELRDEVTDKCEAANSRNH